MKLVMGGGASFDSRKSSEHSTEDNAVRSHQPPELSPGQTHDDPEPAGESSRPRTAPGSYLQFSWKRHFPSRKNGQGFKDL